MPWGLGKPVITTAYSGVTDFCNSETALPIDYELNRVPQGAYPYMDAARAVLLGIARYRRRGFPDAQAL